MNKKAKNPQSNRLFVLINSNHNTGEDRVEVGKLLPANRKSCIKSASSVKSKRTTAERRVRTYSLSNSQYADYYQAQLNSGRVFEIEIKVISECSLTDFMNTTVNTTDTIKVPPYKDDIIRI